MIEVEYWHWLILAALLIPLEILTPALILIWLSIGAFFTALITLYYPGLPFAEQLIFFVLISVASVFLWRWYAVRFFQQKTAELGLNERTHKLMGRVCVLHEPIKDGRGYIVIEQVTWLCDCPDDLPEGDRIRITGIDGTILKVERAEKVAKSAA